MKYIRKVILLVVIAVLFICALCQGAMAEKTLMYNNKKKAIIVIDDVYKLVNTNDPDFNATYYGFDEEDIPKNAEFIRNAGETAGKYTITSNYQDEKYDITVVDGVLTICQYELKVKAKDVVAYVGKTIPALTAEITGAAEGDTITPAFTVKNAEGEVVEVGEIDTAVESVYTIEVTSDADKDKYYIVYESATLTIRKPSARPSGGGTVVKPTTKPESTSKELFTSTIYETNNTVFFDFDLSSEMQDKYMLISGYNSNEIVGRKIILSQNAESLLLMGCKEKPTDLKINVWESLANIKPIADYTEFEGKDENGVQNFTPVNSFPTKYEGKSKGKGYAFINAIGDYSSMGSVVYEMALMNDDGSNVIYNLASDITVRFNETNKEIDNNGNVIEGEGKSSDTNVAEYIENLTYASKNQENFAKRIIKYKANASGKITEITFFNNEEINYIVPNEYLAYYPETKKLGEYNVADAVVFNTPLELSWSEYSVEEIDFLQSGCGYKVVLYDVNDDKSVSVLLVMNVDSNHEMYNSSLALVTGSVVSTNEEGDRVITVTFLQNGEEKTLSVDADATINTPDTNMFVRGDAFEYNVNAEGFIDDAKFCGFGSTVPIKWQEVKALASTIPTKKSGNADFTYIGGYVVAKNGSTLTLANAFNATAGDRVAIPSTANVYVMDVTKTKVIPQVAAIGDVEACKFYTEAGVDKAEEDANTFVLIKYVDKEIVDVIAYCGFDL